MDLIHRKDKLIIAAIDILDELGIQGLSTREIARREGVSEATLFRHFQNKNDLLATVLDFFSQFDNDIYQSIRIKQFSPCEAIFYILSSVAEYYENYPAITSILQSFDILSNVPELTEKIKSIFKKRTDVLKQLVDEAKSIGEIRFDIDSENLACVISGFFREICLKWRLENYQFSFKEKTLSTLKMLLDTVR
jgi:AcrR family transcriptional regulator